MQAPIFPIIGQRLVPRVDDRAIELHPLVNVVDDMIRPLAQLELNCFLGRGNFEIKGERIGLSDPARSRENLPGGQKGEEGAQRRGGELCFPAHQIIFVAAKGRAGVMIDVVLDERNGTGCP